MKKIRVLWLALAGLISSSVSFVTAQVAVESKIESVTVYPEYARLERSAECSLEAGVNVILLHGLPSELVTESVQVGGSGASSVKILDVRTITEYHRDSANEEIRELNNELESIGDQIELNKERSSILSESLEYVRSIRKYMTTHPNEGEEPISPDLEKWSALIGFQESEITRIRSELRELKIANRELERESSRVEKELDRLDDESDTETRSVIVKLEADASTLFTLDLSYMVEEAYWSPVYDVYADLEKSEIELVLKAAVQQTTLEDWSDVEMTLSTAKPSLEGEAPEMSVWRVKRRDETAYELSPFDIDANDREGYTAVSTLAGNRLNTKLREIESDSSKLSDFLYSQDDSSLSSTEFKIPYRVSLPSSEISQQLRISSFTVGSQIYHMAMRPASDVTYLKARAKNPTNFPLLPGMTQVFLDGRFVANSEIELVQAGEEMNFLLGGSSRVKVERKLVNQLDETVGFGGKGIRRTQEYLYTITNNDEEEQLVVIRDQIPLSGNEEIVVELIEPKEDEVDIDEVGMLIWRPTLAPGETIEFKLSFSVQYPKDWQLIGM